eukprot:CAMPEP_0198309612 /NCGR_PEP_ID=MMETSP1450-20131203/1947_1 /TAXON_ID=753684 ORGANISM="Madagascaria erythrocladiodes, Strain CCMP3234" /NCGR_SAMPLE_ID=MMETSP1450 /ASSEMBLY_ACC=CAM_ASM_001115 /LENGTH=115 /DNA_ID=CAMNT_0044012379 /DNA_START=57 /DNA_END=404 /DNA_ORIENTATION=+
MAYSDKTGKEPDVLITFYMGDLTPMGQWTTSNTYKLKALPSESWGTVVARLEEQLGDKSKWLAKHAWGMDKNNKKVELDMSAKVSDYVSAGFVSKVKEFRLPSSSYAKFVLKLKE